MARGVRCKTLCLLLFVFVFVTSCAGSALRAKKDLIGLSRSDLIACAGIPDGAMTLKDEEVLEWKQEQPTQGSFSIKTPFSFEIDLGPNGLCHVVARLRLGFVIQIAYTGPSTTILGPYHACWSLVSACVNWRDALKLDVSRNQGTMFPQRR